ncbi:MAG: D-alanyl-D-alanine carboxypeptidase/D-alanyl-D-alanine-endopeptidase [Bdellovibrionaceae bacterium]|nr:D-alanyl-D-alanine carboxypeptidase/D-alanyl-D-alanine-endopeptidase [Pseudobdellovibrionaceae bacterium]
MLLLIITLWMSAFAQNDATLDAIVKKSKIPEASLGLWIKGSDRSYSHNGDKKFVPASLSKIPTAGAALDVLGLQHKYTTQVYVTGKIDGAELNGDMYLKGGGDPGLVSENFWSIVNELKRSGIRKINGKIYVDDFSYDDDRYSNGRQSRRVDRAYDAPVGALSFNWNSINIFVRPGAQVGDSARVFLDPENEYVQLVNHCKTARKTNIQIDRNSKNNKDVITVSGTIDHNDSEKVVYKSITNPELWAGYNFKAFLNRDGISYSREIEKKLTPPNASLLVSYDSKPLLEIVTDMSKFSNNYVAEMLTKSMSVARPATMDSGVAKIRAWIEGAGLKPTDYTFVSPSGFSHDNLFTPKDLGSLLEKISRDFKIASEFKSALPVSGVDGTLKARLKDQKGMVRAKTGYLAGAVGLAGFFQKNGNEYAFVFMYNGNAKHDAAAKDLFDDLIRKW